MAEVDNDRLAEMLASDWTIEGFTSTMMAAGAMTHSILMRKGDLLDIVTIGVKGDKEVGRIRIAVSPKPEVKKGLFG